MFGRCLWFWLAAKYVWQPIKNESLPVWIFPEQFISISTGFIDRQTFDLDWLPNIFGSQSKSNACLYEYFLNNLFKSLQVSLTGKLLILIGCQTYLAANQNQMLAFMNISWTIYSNLYRFHWQANFWSWLAAKHIWQPIKIKCLPLWIFPEQFIQISTGFIDRQTFDLDWLPNIFGSQSKSNACLYEYFLNNLFKSLQVSTTAANQDRRLSVWIFPD